MFKNGVGVRVSVFCVVVLCAAGALGQGTAGDVVLDGSEPGMSSFGVFLRPKSGFPNIGAKIAGTSLAQSFTVFDSANAQLLTVRGNGAVVIGTRPGNLGRLEVVGTNATSNAPGEVGAYGGILLTNNVDTTVVLRTLGAGLAQLTTDLSGRALSLGSGAFQEAMRIAPNQNIGIGTITPTAKLHVDGSLQVGRHLTLPTWVPLANVNTSGYLKLVTPIVHNESNMFLIHIKGYRYQGAGDPVDIRCAGYAYSASTLINYNCDTAGTSMPVEIGTETRSGPAPVVVIRIGTPGTVWYYPHFTAVYTGWQLKSAAEFTWVVEPTASGTYPGNMNNVMIEDVAGTITLGAAGAGPNRLTVNGSATVTGNITAGGTITGVIQATYQDIAEWVPTTVDVDPGTVVVLNVDRTNEVMPSFRSYDTSVAGVVSAQPGVVLGFGGESKAMIATTGRVKVRVDANRGSIRVGDLLVTSDRPGMAMKSIAVDVNGIAMHRPGTVIGKALEPLAAGEGEILVLLSLQ